MGSYPWHVHCSSANHAWKNRLARDAFTSPVGQPKRVLETDPEKLIFQAKGKKNFMNEFLLLAIIIVYLVVKPPPQGADENISLSRPQKKSNDAARGSADV